MSSFFAHLFWHVVDWLDYRVMVARLRIVDGVCGPEPETEADRQRLGQGQRVNAASRTIEKVP